MYMCIHTHICVYVCACVHVHNTYMIHTYMIHENIRFSYNIYVIARRGGCVHVDIVHQHSQARWLTSCYCHGESHKNTRICIHIHTHTHTHTHSLNHTCTHIHTHTHAHAHAHKTLPPINDMLVYSLCGYVYTYVCVYADTGCR